MIFFLLENRFCIPILHGLGFVMLIYPVDEGEQTYQGLAPFQRNEGQKVFSVTLFFFFCLDSGFLVFIGMYRKHIKW